MKSPEYLKRSSQIENPDKMEQQNQTESSENLTEPINMENAEPLGMDAIDALELHFKSGADKKF